MAFEVKDSFTSSSTIPGTAAGYLWYDADSIPTRTTEPILGHFSTQYEFQSGVSAGIGFVSTTRVPSDSGQTVPAASFSVPHGVNITVGVHQTVPSISRPPFSTSVSTGPNVGVYRSGNTI